MSSFKNFQLRYKNTAGVYKNFVALVKNYKCILLRCPLNHVAHYWKSVLEAMLFVNSEIASLVKDSSTVRTNSVEGVEMTEIKAHLTDVAKEMKGTVERLGNVMWERSKTPPNGMGDIRYKKCSFDYLNTGQIIVVSNVGSRGGEVLLNLPADTTFSFLSTRNMTESINNLLIPVPPNALEDYDHSIFLRAENAPPLLPAEEEGNKEGVVASSSSNATKTLLPNEREAGVVTHISGEVEAFNEANGFGSRRSVTPGGRNNSSRGRKKTQVAEKYPDASPTKANESSHVFEGMQMEKLTFASADDTTLSPQITSSEECNTSSESFSGDSVFSSSCPTRHDVESHHNDGAGDYDSIGSLVNSSPGTPEGINSTAAAVDVVPPGVRAQESARAAYNFDDESRNVQPRFTSSFLSMNDDEDSSDSGGSNNQKSRIRAQQQLKQKFVEAHRKKAFQKVAEQDISTDEESVIDARYASDRDFFVPDGCYEGTHPASAFKNSVQEVKKLPPKLKNGGQMDEEFQTSSSDEEAKVFKVQRRNGDSNVTPRAHKSSAPKKSGSKSANMNSNPQKNSQKAATPRRGQKAGAPRRGQLVLASVNHNPSTTAAPSTDDAPPSLAQVLKNLVIKKRTRDDYKSNPLEDLSVHVTNEVRASPPPPVMEIMEELSTTPDAISALRARNEEIDKNFVLFLVKNCTTRISADIALERCIMDYLCRKQAINNLSPKEQQRIDNLEDIFLSIETLISNEIKAEHDYNHNVLERAHQRTRKSILYKCMIRSSQILQEELSDEQKAKQEDEVRNKERELLSKLNVIATQAKLFNAQTCRFSLRKINTTLHYVCGKFCVVWLEANNCIGELNPDVLRHYNNKAVADAAFTSQLVSATKNGIFLLDCDLELADGVETRGTLEQQQQEEQELRRILDGDHVKQVVDTIKSIADDADRIKSLVKIVWTRETRVKLSHTIAKARKIAEAPPVATTASVNGVATSAVLNSFTPTAMSVVNGIPIATSVQGDSGPQSLETAAAGSKKITSFYGANSTTAANTTSQESTSAQANQSFHRANNKFEADPNSSLTKIARTFDKALRLITGRVQAVATTQCLELTVKSSSINSMLLRLKLLRFLIVHQSKTPSNVVVELRKHAEMYELFDCFFLLKTSSLAGSNTGSDGYCFTRTVHQLYHRSENNFKTSVIEMRELDKLCNVNSETNNNNEFRSFIEELPALMKADSRENSTLISVMGELVYFKRMKQLEFMPALLSVRPPGEPLSALFWGDIQTVTMLGFNVSAFATLIDGEFVRLVPKQRKNWLKYEASSIPKPRSSASIKRSKRPLSEIDQVLAEDLNIMAYASSHFFVCDNPGPINNVVAVFEELKASAMEELLKRVALVQQMTPDALQQLESIISNCEGKSQSTDFDYFDDATFEHAFAKEYPDAIVDIITVDLSQEDANGETNVELHKLKEALELSNAKLKIVEAYGAVLKQNCCALNIKK